MIVFHQKICIGHLPPGWGVCFILLTVGSDTGSDDQQNCKSCLFDMNILLPLTVPILNFTVVSGSAFECWREQAFT